MPLHLYTPICLYAPYTFVCLTGVYTPPYAPILLCASVCSSEALHVVGGFNGIPFVLGHFPYTTPVWQDPPLQLHPPHLVVGFPVHWYVSGISVCYVGIFPSVEGFGSVPGGVPHQLGG